VNEIRFGAALSVTLSVKLSDAELGGVPLIVAVAPDALSVSHPGMPDVVHAYGVVPPVALQVSTYGTLTASVVELEQVKLGAGMTVPLIAADCTVVCVDKALSVSWTLKLNPPPGAVKVPLIVPVPVFCETPAGNVPCTPQMNGGTPPVVEQVTV
jgi:hypothetical protein